MELVTFNGASTDADTEKNEEALKLLAIAQNDLAELVRIDKGKYTLEGYATIVENALECIEEAFKKLSGESAADKFFSGESYLGVRQKDWDGREYSHLRTEGWKD